MNNDKLINEALSAENADDIVKTAEKNGLKIDSEEAEKYFSLIQKNRTQNGELSDNELGNVSGGGCGKSKSKPRMDIKPNWVCDNYTCEECGAVGQLTYNMQFCGQCHVAAQCSGCRFSENGGTICTHPFRDGMQLLMRN